MFRSVYSENALELHHQPPVVLAHVLLEVLLQQVDGLAADAADKQVLQQCTDLAAKLTCTAN